MKYSLVYINPRRGAAENGPVLGYDNSHDRHHRHYMGTVEPVSFGSYRALYDRFVAEVRAIWKEEDDRR